MELEFVTLTQADGRRFIVRRSLIRRVNPHGEGSIVFVDDASDAIQVKESVDAMRAMLV